MNKKNIIILLLTLITNSLFAIDELGGLVNRTTGVGVWDARTIFYTQQIIDSMLTNSSATITNWVIAQHYVTASITNGLASTNWVLTRGYVSNNEFNVNFGSLTVGGNPISTNSGWINQWGNKSYTNSGINVQAQYGMIVTNTGDTNYIGPDFGFADLAHPLSSYAPPPPSTNDYAPKWYVDDATSGLASVSYVNSQGFVNQSVTNGLASIVYVNTATNKAVIDATNRVAHVGYLLPVSTNGLSTIIYVNTAIASLVSYIETITNGMASIAYVSSVTNGMATITYVNTVSNNIISTLNNDTNKIYTYINSVSNCLVADIIAATNGLASKVYVNQQDTLAIITATNNVAHVGYLLPPSTNGLASINLVTNTLIPNALIPYAKTNSIVPINFQGGFSLNGKSFPTNPVYGSIMQYNGTNWVANPNVVAPPNSPNVGDMLRWNGLIWSNSTAFQLTVPTNFVLASMQFNLFTTAGATVYDLDLTSVVPVGAKAVILYSYIETTAKAGGVRFFPQPYIGHINSVVNFINYWPFDTGQQFFYGILPIGPSRHLSYKIDNGPLNSNQLTVFGCLY